MSPILTIENLLAVMVRYTTEGETRGSLPATWAKRKPRFVRPGLGGWARLGGELFDHAAPVHNAQLAVDIANCQGVGVAGIAVLAIKGYALFTAGA